MTREDHVEEAVLEWQLAVAPDSEVDREPEAQHPSRREGADFGRDLGAEDRHAEIAEERDIAAVAKADIEHALPRVARRGCLMPRIIAEERAHHELHRINVDGIAIAIES